MSNTMPFIMSSSPPPIDDCDEEEDDEFGDFRVADLSFSLTDLNQPSESIENENSWIEPTIQTKENELQSSSSPTDDELPNEKSSLAICNKVEESEAEVVENQIEANGISFDLNDVHSEKENCQNIVSDFLNDCTDTKNVSLEPDKDEKPEDVSCAILENESTLDVGFSSSTLEEVNKETERTEKSEHVSDNMNEIVSDDFSDFADFTSGLSNNHSVTKCEPVLNVNTQDDFDDFDDFESAEFKSCPTKEPSVEETLKMMFENPTTSENSRTDMAEIMDSLHLCLDDSSSVWGHLKELETSHALSYQWPNSTANKTLLSSLNIDCRNILFGARWNLCVPRFAANLGVNPLEPVKATETTSFAPVSSVASSSSVEDVVPAAQFDWTSSGLTNPLDGLEKENASSTGEPAMPNVVETSEVETVKPVIDDIFGSITDEVVSKDTEDETVILPSPIPSGSDLPEKKMSAEAYMVVESFPDLSFLSARKLMYAADENMSRWRVKP